MDLNGILSAVYDESLQALRISPEYGPTGRELAYAESAVVQATITTVVDVTGLLIPDFTVGTRPAYVEALLPFVFPVTATGIAVGTITNSANVVQRTGYAGLPSLTITGVLLRVDWRINTPGTYSGYKVRINRLGGATGGGSITNNLDATTISRVRVIEA